MTRRRLLVPAAGLVVLAACAKMAPPPGGPVDNDPPVILLDALNPPDGAAGVAPDSAFVIAFSERTNHRSVMRALRIFPPVNFDQVQWRSDTLRLRAEGGWAAERATLVRLEGSVSDRRGNLLGRPFQTRFSTKAVPDSGVILGRAWGGQELTQERRLLVLAWSPDDSPGGDERWPAAIADVPSGKEFRLEGLDTARPWLVTAVIEGEGSLRGQPPGGVEKTWPDILLFPEGEREQALGDFLVGTLDTVGTIRGEVKTDSARVAVIVARPAAEVAALAAEAEAAAVQLAAEADSRAEGTPADSAAAPAPDSLEEDLAEPEAPPRPFDDWVLGAPLRTAPLGAGDFSLQAPTGEVYRIGAFVDLDADSLPDPDEPRVALERDFSLRYVSSLDGPRFDLRGLAPWPVVAPDSAAADSLGGEGDSAAADSLSGEGESEPASEEESGP